MTMWPVVQTGVKKIRMGQLLLLLVVFLMSSVKPASAIGSMPAAMAQPPAPYPLTSTTQTKPQPFPAKIRDSVRSAPAIPAASPTSDTSSAAARPARQARKGPPRGPLKVLTKIIPPFVMHGADGRLQGFSIDLWHAIAQRLGRDSEIVLLPSLTVLLDDIRKGVGDAAIAAITITAEREKVMDFSYPYFRSGLQIMVRSDEGSVLTQALSVLKGMLTSRSFRIAMVALAVLVLVTAHVIWLVERHRNPEFRHAYPLGLWDAVYWTVVTISTVGYGDKTPKTHLGRAIALVLIVFGYIAFAWFTATITSAVTITKLEGTIGSPADLPGKRVATVRNSTSASYLSRLPGVKVFLYDRIEDAYAMLEAGRVDAVVYDFPVLSHYVMTKGREKVKLVGPVFQHEPYGIALPEGSHLRERINRALLSIQESGEYARLYQKWFGPTVK